MAQPKERAVITGNRFEAYLSATRRLADIKDRKREGSLTLLRATDMLDVELLAETLSEEMRTPSQDALPAWTGEYEPLQVGRLQGKIEQNGASIRDTKEGRRLNGLAPEDLAELGELAQTLKGMMEDEAVA
jgi:hypothetical protein